MKINCNGVIDISSVNSMNNYENERFFLDTNIWMWLTYTNSDLEKFNTVYASFIHDIYISEAKLARSKMTYGELTHIIEHSQYKNSSHTNVKEFRNNEYLRKQVVDDVKNSINQMDEMVDVDAFIKEDLSGVKKEDFFDYLSNSKLDGTDMLMAIAIKNNEIINVVSDDQDFTSVPNIRLFTLNKKVIKEAKRMGKLIS